MIAVRAPCDALDAVQAGAESNYRQRVGGAHNKPVAIRAGQQPAIRAKHRLRPTVRQAISKVHGTGKKQEGLRMGSGGGRRSDDDGVSA